MESKTWMLSYPIDRIKCLSQQCNLFKILSQTRVYNQISQTCCCAGLPSLLLSSPFASFVSSFPPTVGRQSAAQPCTVDSSLPLTAKRSHRHHGTSGSKVRSSGCPM